MDPYHNFDHRPLCADHREITLPRKAVNTIDHTNIAPSGGPVRTQKDSPRVTPYSSPSPEPQRRLPVVVSSSSSSIESLSSELEYDSDRERLAHSQIVQQRSYIYDSDHRAHKTPRNAKSDPSPTKENLQASTSTTEETRSHNTVTLSEPAPPRGPPALVFENDSDDDFLIPKPPGEVGRPGRGGYSLFEVLLWPRKKYDKVKKFINNLVEDHLDCDVPMSEQSAANVRKVRQQAVEKYIFLKEYSGLWAVDDFIRNHLKYQKSVLRKERLEKIAADACPGAGAEKKGSKRTSSGK